jgi:hypothetical protein
MTPVELYQAEVTRRFKEGVPADEQPSLLSRAVSTPLFVVPGNHDNPDVAQTSFFEIKVHIEESAKIFESWLTAESTAASTASSTNPPAMSEFLFSVLGPKVRVDSMLGDLEERFHADRESVGKSRARWRYRSRVWRSLGPLICHRLKNWGFLAFLLELGRRKIGW